MGSPCSLSPWSPHTSHIRLRLSRLSRLSTAALALCLSSLLIGADQPAATAPPQDLLLLQSLTRTLEEEIKLASKPQPYLLLDSAQSVFLLKSRGLILRRFPILAWQAVGDSPPPGVVRLRARPPITRPKIQPGQDSTEHPIDVSDMPMEYLLVFDHDLVIEILPPLTERPWYWIRRKWLNGWNRFQSWMGQDSGREFPAASPRMSLVLAPEEAQSLAWAVTEGMPLLMGRVEPQ